MKNTVFKDYLHMHFLILLWGFTAILGLLIKISALELVFYRTLIATAGLWMVLFYLGISLRIKIKEIRGLLGIGLLIFAHWILFFGSARVSTASVSLAGLSTITFFTSLLEPLMKKKKIEWLEVVFGMMVIGGLYLIFHFEFTHAFGLVLSLLSAFLGALFTVLNSKITLRQNHFVISFYEMAGANISAGIFILAYYLLATGTNTLHHWPSNMDWIYLVILALICTVYPFAVSIELMKRITAFSMNLAVNLEPVYGIILAVIIFGDKEKMNTGFYAGTLVILLSVILYPLLKNRRILWKKLITASTNTQPANDQP